MGALRDWLTGGTAVDPVADALLPAKGWVDGTADDGWGAYPNSVSLDGFTEGFPTPYTVNSSNGIPVELILSALRGMDPAELWRTQDSVRAVTGFLARNQAQVGLHVFDRVGDTDRERITDGVLPRLLRRPNRTTYYYRFMEDAYLDHLIHDNSWIWVRPDKDRPDGWSMWLMKAEWFSGTRGGSILTGPESYGFMVPGGTEPTWIPADQIIHIHGYSPSRFHSGVSPLEALKGTLAEQVAASTYRLQRWEKGPRVSGVLTRPAGAPRWSETAEDRFKTEWRNQFAGRQGTDVAGTPILQDGMTYQQMGWSAQEDQYIEGSKLARVTVAAAYYLNPIFVGYLDKANFSNTVIFRQMLFGQTLGPSFAQWAGALNAVLPEKLGMPDSVYLEFNVEQFLQASFEERAAVTSTAVGGPWLTRNEARAMINRPAIDGADDLIVPMNVTEGGQASPNTPIGGGNAGTPQVKAGKVGIKAQPTDTDRRDMEAALVGFFGRQGKAVLARLAAQDPAWWQADRWDRELAADLTAAALPLGERYGQQVMDQLNSDLDYDVERVAPYTAAVMGSRAGMINAATYRQIVEVLGQVPAGADLMAGVTGVFSSAKQGRATAGGRSLTTTVAGLSTEEAAKQAYPEPSHPARKTWRTRSAHPRAAHAAMNGQTVGVFENFSNGAAWPGDAILGPDGVSNCKCIITVSEPEEPE